MWSFHTYTFDNLTYTFSQFQVDFSAELKITMIVKDFWSCDTRDVFYVRRKVDLMKKAKVNAYVMHIFGKIELLAFLKWLLRGKDKPTYRTLEIW